MKKIVILLFSLFLVYPSQAQKNATIRESMKVFKTYGFSDPNPIPETGKIYPYYRFDGYTNTGVPKEWKVVELENDFIKVMVMPEIGGKIWAAWEKSTGKPFIYYNQVVKFRDVAMRGPWTSGGIEANYGIIGHTPNCATPMDYLTETKDDGSVSCYIGTLDLLTQTYWTIEINLPKDKAYFTTRSFWSNSTPVEQPYYTWMNVGMKSGGNLEFVYPGNRYIGHSGEYSDWKINPENGKDISFYENNNFGGYKSYHVFGKYANFFGAYYHDEDFGMARYSLRDEKPGKKIWIWGLSQQGMIWEKLLSDTDGQYVEVQSGRLFNQASDGSNYTPFKQLGFAPHSADEWTEYWFPVKGIKGFVKANPYGALNLRADKSTVKIDFLPMQDLREEIKVQDGDKIVYSKTVSLTTLKPFSDTFSFNGNTDNLTVTIGDKMKYHADPKHGLLNRPVDAPENFDWNSAFGLHTLGKEFIQQRYYPQAEEKLKAALQKDPNYLPALTDLAMIAFRNMEYDSALHYARHALSIDTYDPAANFYYGLANDRLGNIMDARDGFDIASLSPAWRSAAYTELARISLRENDYAKALHYAEKSLGSNSGNTAALQTIALVSRLTNDKQKADDALRQLRDLSPLNHFIRFEQHLWQPTERSKQEFVSAIRNEMKHETFLELANWYSAMGQLQESVDVLMLAPENPVVLYRIAYLQDQLKSGSGKAFIEKANSLPPTLVFPFRESTAETLAWVISESQDWKPNYYLALIHLSRNNAAAAKELFAACGEPDFAPFYAARAELMKDGNYARDLRRAAQLDPQQWRYGKMLADYYIGQKKYEEALGVSGDYVRRFPGDFRLGMLHAKALLLNKQYKQTTDVLARTTILPYEGATDGRQLYREAWLMQAIEQIRTKRYTSALASLAKARLWPENLGAGKPYDEDIDLRVEHYLEALVHERTKEKEKANQRYNAIIRAEKSGRNQINDLITALAYRKTGRVEEGKKLLAAWKEKQPDNAMAQWAYAVYNGESAGNTPEGNDSFRIIQAIVAL